MLRGIYTAAAGMLVQHTHNDVVANNLANASTPGFRRDRILVRSFPQFDLYRTPEGAPVGSLTTGAAVDEVVPDMMPGPIKFTGNDLDLALEGPGYFAVATPQGIAYTRSGSFMLDGEGYLATKDGYRLLGRNGPLAGSGPVTGNDEGLVFAGDEAVDGLLIVDFPPGTVPEKMGTSLVAGPAAPVEEVRVRQGHLEMANVNVVREMIDLIAVMRAYEANQKIIQAHDETLGKAVNEMGRSV